MKFFENHYDWERRWISADAADRPDPSGFHSDLLSSLNGLPGGAEALSLRQLSAEGCLILRGPSGAGKTTAMRQEMRRLEEAGLPHAWIDMAADADTALQVLDERARRDGTTLFIDGLDVALHAHQGFADRLGVALERLKEDLSISFRVRIAVRTGVRCDALLTHVERAFALGQSEMKIVPLTERDVRRAARTEEIDPDDFFSYIRAVLAGPLAAQPPTLTMLFAIWKNQAEQELPLRRDRLYGNGVRRLLDERNRERRSLGGGDDPKFIGSHSIEERVAICGRIAAAMHFSDKLVLDLRRDEDGRSALPVDVILGGYEPVGSSQVEVRLQGVREVVRTALFRPEGDDRFSFAHPSFAEFLAAQFILRHEMKLQQILSLVSTRNPDCRLPIANDRVAIASWLAAERYDIYEYLADNDPQVILRAGVPSPTVKARMRLARGLLKANAEAKLDLEELLLSGDLAMVSNRDLYPEVVAILSDANIGQNERTFAISLIAYCPSPVDPTPLLPVILNPDEPLKLRSSALAALRHTEIEKARSAIFKMASAGLLQDDGEELRGLALMIAYPKIVNAEEFLRLIPLAGDRIPFSLHGASSLHFFKHLVTQDLPSVLDTACKIVRRTRSDYAEQRNLVYLIGGIAKLALSYLADVEILHRLARLIIAIPDNDDWRPWHYTIHNRGMPDEATDELRRNLILSIAAQAPSSVVAKTLLEISFLVREHDLDWIVSQARRAQASAQKSVLVTLAVERARRQKKQSTADILRILGLHEEAFAKSAAKMPVGFERWTLPQGYQVQELESIEDETEDKDEASFLTELDDFRIRQLRATTDLRGAALTVEPRSILILADDASARLVRNDHELCELVLESLERFAMRLRGEHGVVRALWDQRKDDCEPKGELFLSDFLADHLKTDLAGSSVVADREVQVRARIGEESGQRSDIKIQAFTKVPSGFGRKPVASITIEVKVCDNGDLYTAMKDQLLDRYMKTTGDQAGIYLVGWYVCKSWKTASVARKHVSGTIATLRQELSQQARGLTSEHQRVVSFVVDASL